MFEFIEVEKSFQEDFWKAPKMALNKLSFQVEPGSLCGFLGANGAGKTTSIKTFFKFINHDNGNILYSPKLGNSWNDIKGNIGYFPERPYYYSHMTGREFCRYIFSLGSGNNFDSCLKKWSEKINIAYALDQKLHSYSKGMLQRIGFVTAVIASPKLVILDEPLSGLDPIGRKEFKDVLKELHSEGVTIFFSSHIVSDVEEICDQLVVIKEGKTSYCGSTEDLLKKNQDYDFSELYFYIGREKKIEEDGVINHGNDYYQLKLKAENIDEKIMSLQKAGARIHKLVPLRPSLESIVYQEGK